MSVFLSSQWIDGGPFHGQIFTVAFLWLALAVLSALIAFHLRVAVALMEICVGIAVAAAFSECGLQDLLLPNADWVRFLAALGAVVLRFLRGRNSTH